MRQMIATALVVTVAGVLVLPQMVTADDNSANAHLCQHDGYKSLLTSDGESFKNAGDCVSYAAQGGSFGGADLSISLGDSETEDPMVVVRNDGPLDTSVTVRFTSLDSGIAVGPFSQNGLPVGWNCVFGAPDGENWTAECSTDSLAAHTETIFNPRLHHGWEVEVVDAEEQDPDSTPDNQDPDEDDYLLIPDF